MDLFTTIITSILTIGCIIVAASLLALIVLSTEVDDAWEQFLEEYLKDGGAGDDIK